ncbi:MAG: translation initiation factor IF-2, partial [Candidatus Omnitrophica bacterium]|nr:translation initiation factor IF-2 [Candidatus Omnitrophota bacterium]
MKVLELAKELNISNDVILEKLRSLKLRAQDGNQELNRAVLIVVKSALVKDLGKGVISTVRAKSESKAVPVASPVSKTEKKSEAVLVAEEEKPKKTTRSRKPTAEKEKSAEMVVEKKKPVKKSAKVEKVIEEEKQKLKPQPEIKKAEVIPPAPPPIPKAVPAPFVALKPLPKKRRKMMTPMGESAGVDSSSSVASSEMRSEGGGSGQLEEGGTSPAVILKDLELNIPISVKDFSTSVNEKPSIVLKKLMQMGIFAHINQNLDEEIVRRLAPDFGYQLTKIKTPEELLVDVHKFEEEDNPELLKPRAPVVTLMGHVDHGKTTLLDKIRKARVADQEHGGITQHIGAYSVSLPKGKITFLDTPGHEAFTAMRARGAHITDLVVLVVAADEGVMPQTDEAINHARAANVPIVVALTKMDKPNINLDRVKKQLADRELAAEDWGGKTVVVGVSALTGEGVDTLLEMILLESELLELKANPQKRAAGIVVEAHLSGGKGSVASLIVQSGTLHLQDLIVIGPYYGKVKALFDHLERPIQEAGPSTPVEILGLPSVPEAGEKFYVVEDEKQAKDITAIRQEKLKRERLGASAKRITLEDLYSHIKEGKVKELNVILKADVQGSVEALKDSIAKIPSEEVKVKFIHTG